MPKYKIEFIQTEKYLIDVKAKDQASAERIARKAWNAGNYQETGDYKVSIGNIYNVSGTDDPFMPIN